MGADVTLASSSRNHEPDRRPSQPSFVSLYFPCSHPKVLVDNDFMQVQRKYAVHHKCASSEDFCVSILAG